MSQQWSRSRAGKIKLRRLPTGIEAFREDPGGLGLSRGLVRLRLAIGLARQTVLPVATSPLRPEPLVETLKDLFEGTRELFEGMAIEPHAKWPAPRAAVRLDS